MAALETRGAIGEWDADSSRFTSAPPRRCRTASAASSPPPLTFPRIASGSSSAMSRRLRPQERPLSRIHPRPLGGAAAEPPVKWISERGEAFLSDYQGRDNVSHVEMAMDAARQLPRLARLDAGQSRRLSRAQGAALADQQHAWAFPAAIGRRRSTHRARRSPTPRRPMYIAAPDGRRRSISRTHGRTGGAPDRPRSAELRRRNMVTPAELPFSYPARLVYDSADLVKVLDTVPLDAADWRRFAERRAASRDAACCAASVSAITRARRWRLVGKCEIRLDASGKATALLGTCRTVRVTRRLTRRWSPRGSASTRRGRVGAGDTDRIASGHGTGGFGLDPIGGAALDIANDQGDRAGTPHRRHLLETARRHRFQRRLVHRRGQPTGGSRSRWCAGRARPKELPPGTAPGLAIAVSSSRADRLSPMAAYLRGRDRPETGAFTICATPPCMISGAS